MEKSITIDNKEYTIPAIFSYSEKAKKNASCNFVPWNRFTKK